MTKEFPDARGPNDHPIPELAGGKMPPGLAPLPSSPEVRRAPPPAQADWRVAVIAKMPDFNPGWTEEVQAKWFTAIEKILAIIEKSA